VWTEQKTKMTVATRSGRRTKLKNSWLLYSAWISGAWNNWQLYSV